ncbi:MAG: hypothetical protein JXE06_05985 [Coriobacteriia bacterium]|nr:hypothetical protein [Coriobacteriia bacterium]MBN2821672.1 hypothetical protein [Coriobacteriia bacterium]
MKHWLDDESGFAITTLLLIVSVATSVIVGGSSTVAAVQNRADLVEASDQMASVAAEIEARTAGDDSPRAEALRDYAGQMRSTSDAMTAGANQEVFVAVRNNIGDAVLTPLQGGKLITAAKFGWDLKTGWELGDTAMNSWGITDPGADPLIAQLQALRVDKDYNKPVEQAIAEAKLRGARAVVAQADPGLSGDELTAAASQLVLDIETTGDQAGAGSDFHNGYLAQVMSGIGFNIPDDAAMGDDSSGDDEYTDDASGDAANDGGQVAVGGPLTEGVWDVEALQFKVDGFISSEQALSQPFDSKVDGTGYSSQRTQYWFEADGTMGYKWNGFYYEGTYTFDGCTGEVVLDPGRMPEALEGVSFYYDSASDRLYVVEHIYYGERYDRAVRLHH